MNIKMEKNIIWTIGHSTRTIEEFISLLKKNNIEILIDVRSMPGSRKFPQFNKEILSRSLEEQNIKYRHLNELGGRRKKNKESQNTAWHNLSFRNYADYMETPDFEDGIKKLIHTALRNRTCYMCSEALWWRCHRSMISDYLKTKGWEVLHILSLTNVQKHPFTQVAHIANGKLDYQEHNNK